MHRAVMQNDKYIDFANENTVEVISLQQLDKGIGAKDPKAATYKTKDGTGKEVEYLVEFPGLTVDDVNGLYKSKAPSYNDTRGIPYTALVNPHTLKKMRGYSGAKTAKDLIEAVEMVKAELNEQHGPSISRKVLKKFSDEEAKVREVLAKKGAAKALAAYKKLEKLASKNGDAMKKKAEVVKGQLLEAAVAELDKAEELIDSGDTKGALKILNSLKNPLKKTDHKARLNELLNKAKPAAK